MGKLPVTAATLRNNYNNIYSKRAGVETDVADYSN